MIGEKIKKLRKQAKMSQEALANKLNVSRQAVTKWETGVGMPDISNLVAIAKLFQVSVDELLGNNSPENIAQDLLFESITEYDIVDKKHYDITFKGSKLIKVIGYEGEKIRIRLASNKISDIQNAFKVKLDDIRNRLDVDIKRVGDINETLEKSDLYVFIYLPLRYTGDVEMNGNTDRLEIANIETDKIEFSGKVRSVSIKDSSSHVEIDSNEDMELRCDNLIGRLDINQISSNSRLYLPDKTDFLAVSKGIKNKISYEKDRKKELATEADLMIELNGIKNELVII